MNPFSIGKFQLTGKALPYFVLKLIRDKTNLDPLQVSCHRDVGFRFHAEGRSSWQGSKNCQKMELHLL